MTSLERTSTMQRVFILLLAVVALCPGRLATAALTIDIIGFGANQIPIAIAPFRAEEGTRNRSRP